MKFKLTMKITREYEVTEEDLRGVYGGLDTFEDALALDIENTKDDPYLFLDFEDVIMEVKGEIL